MDDIHDDYIFSDPRYNLCKAESDPEAAVQILTVAAEYLRECQGKGFPADLAEYLAQAFEAAASEDGAKKGLATLGRKLNLTAGHRRKTNNADLFEVGEAFRSELDIGKKQDEAKETVSKSLGISESTVLRMWKQYKDALEEHDRICREEYDQ